MSDAEFPPNFAVITAAAVAVGHSRHIIADSMRTLAPNGISWKKANMSDSTMNGGS